MVLDP
jgi:hypothetical protein